MRGVALSLFATLTLALTACSPAGDGKGAGAAETAPLANAAIGGDFVLTDQDGKPFDSKSLKGQYRLYYFGYTFCPDVCPVDLTKLMQGLKLVEKEAPELGAKITPLFITIDPARDTPPVMKQYAAAMHPRLIGLTGTPEQIAKIAKAYAIYYARNDQEGAADYLMDHSRQAYLFGPDGNPLALLPVEVRDDGKPSSPADIAAEIRRWAK